MKLNTPGQRNGEFMLFNNGELVIHLTDVNYRATDSIKIMGVHFNTFYGGSDSTWYPDEMNSIDFRVSYFFIKELYFSCLNLRLNQGLNFTLKVTFFYRKKLRMIKIVETF